MGQLKMGEEWTEKVANGNDKRKKGDQKDVKRSSKT
jgi:hypothetical protein